MALLFRQDRDFHTRVAEAVSDDFAHDAIRTAQDVFHDKRAALVEQVPEWEDFRTEAAGIRDHVLDNLDYYVDQFARNARANGSIVHFAPTAMDAVADVMAICEYNDAHTIVKSKSMVTEEIDLNRYLKEAGLDVNETDLAEHILQTAGCEPSHIVVPALHYDRGAIQDIYKDLGYEGSDDPEEITRFVRGYLRRKFLSADIGITGCNFGVAETGAVTLVTNEGNGSMVTTVPRVRVVLMGMERLVPDMRSLDVMMELLVRSSVGSKVTSYFNLAAGPRKPGEVDGPEQLHIIIVDNGRSEILARKDGFRDMLRCIRCGACLNACPVYRHITGHAYGSIYPGPMGAVLTPLFAGYDKAGDLPYGCSLCGACDDDCPVKIPLHSLIRKHRNIQAEKEHRISAPEAAAFSMAGAVLANAGLYSAGTKVGALGMPVLGARDGQLYEGTLNIPILKGWTASRNMDLLSKQKFRDWAAAHPEAFHAYAVQPDDSGARVAPRSSYIKVEGGQK